MKVVVMAFAMIIMLAGMPASVQAQSDEGLVAEWHFDGDAKDSSGNGNDGTIYGATFVEGIKGKALSFNGLNNYVEIPHSTVLQPERITVVAWVKLAANTPSNDIWGIVTKDNPNDAWTMQVHGSQSGQPRTRPGFANDVGFYVRTDVGAVQPFIKTSLEVGSWYQIAGVYDGNYVMIYLNGVKKDSMALTGTILQNTNPANIGRTVNYPTRLMNGVIDEVRIYNRALNADEIKANYEAYTIPASMPTPTLSPTQTPIFTPTPTATLTSKPSASVQLHGEKTDVLVGEDIIFKLSAVNKITKPVMAVQVILIPPSGMSVTSSEFATSGAGQYTTTYKLDPGAGKDIEVRIKTNQQGDFNVKGEIIYYYGDDKSTAEDQTLNLPIKVREEISKTPTTTPQSPTLSFWVSILVFGISYRLIKRN